MPSDPSATSARIAPLAGLRVLDFTALPPGGACTVMLADLGAEVIRVEPPAQAGKPSLVIGQVALSRAKKSITLDMRNPASSDLLLRLAPTIDIVVENAKPGAMAARGFGYAQARAANPGIVWCAITGFGQTGPYADHAGHDISYLAHSGLLTAITGGGNGRAGAWQPGIALSLQAGAMAAVIGIQSALLRRQATGEGAFVDQSLAEAAGWFLTCGINPLSADPMFLPATPDRRLYTCADGRQVAVACAEPRTWGVLCDLLEVPDLKPALHQAADAAATAARLEAIFRTRPAADWVALVAPAGGAVTLVNHGADLLADAQVQARGGTVAVAGISVPASPIRIAAGGAASGTATEPPHRVGDDTDAVLRAAGFSADEIAGHRAAGLV